MASVTLDIDLNAIAQHLHLDLRGVTATVQLLDEGNTVPFITRYRKDRTGGLDEEQIRAVQSAVTKARQLLDRKQTVLKSIESQGKLTDDLARRLQQAMSQRAVEDIYLPFKPKKKTRATLARQRGLEPAAEAVLAAGGRIAPGAASGSAEAAAHVSPASSTEASATEANAFAVGEVDGSGTESLSAESPSAEGMAGEAGAESAGTHGEAVGSTAEHSPAAPVDLAELVQPYVNVERDLKSVADVLDGIKSLIAERFSEHAKMRAKLRNLFWREAKLVTRRVELTPEEVKAIEDGTAGAMSGEHDLLGEHDEPADGLGDDEAADELAAHDAHDSAHAADSSTDGSAPTAGASEVVESHLAASELADSESSETVESPAESPESLDSSEPSAAAGAAEATETSGAGEGEAHAVGSTSPSDSGSVAGTLGAPAAGAGASAGAVSEKKPGARGGKGAARVRETAQQRREQRRDARRRKREKLEQSFKDYFNYQDPLSKIPPHRVLAINRGERTRVLRCKFDIPVNRLVEEAAGLLYSPEHPYASFLHDCLSDAMQRLILPGLEREIRREITDRAIEHAVRVFAQNLRKLLLQPPLHNRRVLAVDPGFRSGCKLVALDEFGSLLGHAVIHVIGNEGRRKEARQRIADLVRQHRIDVIAIGNGTGCRETEQLVAATLADELAQTEVSYLVVNEAGASVYSTSSVGREELPGFDATMRGAVSIGRRALDPLSELVKIDPASIGVGLYQHDVKAKDLRESLDAVVESCVNFVGVDVNSASPALLRYVSGLNQLTARRVYEYRCEKGPFKNREAIKQVPGIGEASYVQAAGFLKIAHGDTPLDATWIHPESYEIAERVLRHWGYSLDDLSPRSATPVAADSSPVSAELVSAELVSAEVGGDAAADAVAVAPSEASGAVEGSEPAEPSAAVAVPAVTSGSGALPLAAHLPSGTPSVATPSIDGEFLKKLRTRVAEVNIEELARELGVGPLSLKDILDALARPGRDPREDLPPPLFRREILKLEDLKPGMKLSGTVLNVVDFGAFVDIGIVDSGLVHVSRLADRFIRDPHEVVSVGDLLDVWVVEVDQQRRRVSLTAIEPGTERPRPARRVAGDGEAAGAGRGSRPPRGPGRSGRSAQRAPQGTSTGPGGGELVGAGVGPSTGDAPAARAGDGNRGGQGRRSQSGSGQGDRGGQEGRAGGEGRSGGNRAGQAGRGGQEGRGGYEGRARSGRRDGQGKRDNRPKKPTQFEKIAPRTIVPITKEMREGRAPMRTFSDLKQFFEPPPPDAKPEEKPEGEE